MGPGGIRCLLLLAALLSMPAPAAERRALLVGANEGWDEPKLSYARKDARKLREVLVQLGGFAKEDIVLLEDPAVSELREQLGEMKRRFEGNSGEETLFVFYYSGHADGEHLHLQGSPPFSFKELLRHLREVPSTQKVGILDACQSGSILKGARLASSGFEVSREEELAIRGLALLVSSTASEPSIEHRELGGSVFTHHLVSGLFGLADLNRDRRVSLEEAHLHARERTLAATANAQTRPQHPGAKIEMAGHEGLYLTYLDVADAVLSFPPSGAPCYLADRFETRLLAEISPSDSRSLVRVLPGAYILKCEGGTEFLRVARVIAKSGEVADVSGLRFYERTRGPSLTKGGRSIRSTTLLPIVSGGVLASGAVFMAMAKREHWRIPGLDSLPEAEKSAARGRTYQSVGLGLMGAGVLGLGVATGLHVLREPKPSGSLAVGTNGTSVVVHGTWP